MMQCSAISALRLETADVPSGRMRPCFGAPKRGRCLALALASGPQPLLQSLRALAASPRGSEVRRDAGSALPYSPTYGEASTCRRRPRPAPSRSSTKRT